MRVTARPWKQKGMEWRARGERRRRIGDTGRRIDGALSLHRVRAERSKNLFFSLTNWRLSCDHVSKLPRDKSVDTEQRGMKIAGGAEEWARAHTQDSARARDALE